MSKGRTKDYVAARGTITISAGELTGTISINILADNILEVDETFNVVLTLHKNAAATLTKAIGVVIIKDGAAIDITGVNENAYTAMAQEKQEAMEQQFKLKALPNPSVSYFTVLATGNINTAISIRVIYVAGRIIEVRNNVYVGQTIKIGDNYRPGTYYVEAIQGKEKRSLKLIKLSK